MSVDKTKRNTVFLGARQTSVFNRSAAKSIDFIVASAIFVLGQAIISPLGLLLAAAYGAFCDSMGSGQSIGKRIFGLRVIENTTETPCSFNESLIRNLPFCMLFLVAVVPLFWGALVLLDALLLFYELYLVANLDSGIRLGDVLANTLVVEVSDDILI